MIFSHTQSLAGIMGLLMDSVSVLKIDPGDCVKQNLTVSKSKTKRDATQGTRWPGRYNQQLVKKRDIYVDKGTFTDD